MPLRMCSLASGSSGNACLIWTDTTRILVDNGLSVKTLRARLQEIGQRLEGIDCFAITHAHIDHVGGLVRAMRESIRRGKLTPAWMTRETADLINWGTLEKPPVKYFDPGSSFVVGDIQVGSLTVPHDCASPVAFTFTDNHSKIGIATDLGFIPPALVSRFRNCNAVMIESNYDLDMLEACDRPEEVKQRIAGRFGHLSNQQTTEFLECELGPSVQTLVLGHLSGDNNHPDLCRGLAQEVLRKAGRFPRIVMAGQDQRTEVLEV